MPKKIKIQLLYNILLGSDQQYVGAVVQIMAKRRAGDLMLTQFTDAYLPHTGSIN